MISKSLVLFAVGSVACYNEALSNLIEKINTSDTTWTADSNSKFLDWTPEQLQKLFVAHEDPLDLPIVNHSESKSLPRLFDLRTEHPSCSFEVRDQMDCGGCYAFAAVEVLEDRYCIASRGSNVSVGVQDLISCDGLNGGCNGGQISRAMEYLNVFGAVSESCFPFSSDQGVEEECPMKMEC